MIDLLHSYLKYEIIAKGYYYLFIYLFPHGNHFKIYIKHNTNIYTPTHKYILIYLNLYIFNIIITVKISLFVSLSHLNYWADYYKKWLTCGQKYRKWQKVPFILIKWNRGWKLVHYKVTLVTTEITICKTWFVYRAVIIVKATTHTKSNQINKE